MLSAQLTPIVRREAATKFGRAVDRTTTRLDKTVPFKTGALKRSRRVRISTAGDLLTADVEYTKKYGDYLDEGVRPHTIRPRNAKALRFVVGGRVVFAKVVHHPGTNKHRGWFSRIVSAADWRLTLNQVFGG